MKKPLTVREFVVGFGAACLFVYGIRSCEAAEWDTTDKVLFGSYVALQVIDTAQTYKVHKHPDQWEETNPIYGKDPNMLLVVGLKSLVVGGTYWLVKDMSGPHRKLVLGAVNALQFSIVAGNYQVGLKFGF